VLPGVGAGLETGRVCEIETGLILKIVREKPGFDLPAELGADGLAEVKISKAAGG
jgi:hypothetical protein